MGNIEFLFKMAYVECDPIKSYSVSGCSSTMKGLLLVAVIIDIQYIDRRLFQRAGPLLRYVSESAIVKLAELLRLLMEVNGENFITAFLQRHLSSFL